MKPEIQKHGEGFYSIGPILSQGHLTATGQRLVAPENLVLPLRRDTDPEGVNLDPVDVLSVLHMHFGADTPAGKLMEQAVEIIEGTATKPVRELSGAAVPRLGKGKPGPKPKAKSEPAEEVAA